MIRIKRKISRFPYDVYGESKLTNEFQARRFQRETQIDTVAIRLSNVYGPRETNPHVIPEIMTQLIAGKRKIALGNIDPKRDFVYTSDVARGFVDLALQPLSGGFHVVNLGSGKEYSIRELLEKLSSIVGEAVVYEKDPTRFRTTERMHLVADIECIQRLIGWQPQVSIDRGLKELYGWYRMQDN